MSTQWTRIAALVTILMISGSVLTGAQSSQTRSDMYTWSGELVSLDATAMTMTVKSRVAYQEAISELKQFKPGDRVWIVWSGVSDSSDAVRQVRRSETGRRIDENLVLPAELMSTDATNSYITISGQGAGEWARSRQGRQTWRVGHRDVAPPPCERRRGGGGGDTVVSGDHELKPRTRRVPQELDHGWMSTWTRRRVERLA
jgi:hypothetical protein